MSARVASAPGKLVLGGEYAVLEGAPAIVAAVQVRARVRFADAGSSIPPEVAATRRRLEAELGPIEGALAIDVAALRAGEHKLGVGSSAAAAVAAAALLLDAHGQDVDASRARIFALALDGHREVAPRGSGIDVAASTHGGVLRFRREGERALATPLAMPPLHASVTFTGSSARTSDLLDRVAALAASSPSAHRGAMDRLGEAAHVFAEAFERADVPAILDATRAYHRAMAALGEAASAPIVEARLAAIAALAERHGGAGKPSGAGGGDVAVTFFASIEDRLRFEADARASTFTVLEVALGGEGVAVQDERADARAAR